MKKYFMLLFMFMLLKAGSAQYSLTFCEDITAEGKPAMASNSFMIDNAGSALRFYLKADSKLQTISVDFKVFYVGTTGKEEEIARFTQKTEADWAYAWKEAAFYEPGTYRIKVYDEAGTYLTSANLVLKKR